MLFGKKIPKKLLKFTFKKTFGGVATPVFIFIFVFWQDFTPQKNPHKLP